MSEEVGIGSMGKTSDESTLIRIFCLVGPQEPEKQLETVVLYTIVVSLTDIEL